MKLADFVKEECSTFTHSYAARIVSDRSCKGPFNMTEQFTFRQLWG